MHAVDDLDFQKVIAGAERATLVVAAGDRPVADPAGVGSLEAAAGLRDEEIALRPIPQVDDVRRALGHQPGELGLIELVAPALADAGGNVAEKLFHQRPDPILDLAEFEVRAQQADTAVDVVADAAGGDDAPFLGVGRRHSADAEAVAPVNIGHGQAGLLDAGQRRHVGDLLGALVALDLLDQRLVREDDAVDAHVSAI